MSLYITELSTNSYNSNVDSSKECDCGAWSVDGAICLINKAPDGNIQYEQLIVLPLTIMHKK